MISDTPRQLPLPLRLDDDATFDNFLTTPVNEAVIQYLQRHDADVGAGQRAGTVLRDFVWLVGPCGAGKSHLLQALCHQASLGGDQFFYLPMAEVSELDPGLLEGMENLDLLCLDDVEQATDNKEWELALFHLYNRMANTGTRLVVSSRVSPRQLTTSLPDLHSRWQSASVFELAVLDDEAKIAALQMRARGRGLVLSDEVAHYLMSRIGRDMGTLLRSLQALDAHSLETKRRITVPLVRSLMGW